MSRNHLDHNSDLSPTSSRSRSHNHSYSTTTHVWMAATYFFKSNCPWDHDSISPIRSQTCLDSGHRHSLCRIVMYADLPNLRPLRNIIKHISALPDLDTRLLLPFLNQQDMLFDCDPHLPATNLEQTLQDCFEAIGNWLTISLSQVKPNSWHTISLSPLGWGTAPAIGRPAAHPSFSGINCTDTIQSKHICLVLTGEGEADDTTNLTIQVDTDSDDPQHNEYQPNNCQSPQDTPPAEDMTVEGPTQGTAANAPQKKRPKIKNDAKFRSSYSRKLIALKRPHQSDGTFGKESTFQCKS
ncbi:uncharacterized protein UDID_18453 [Ustilago sp. UG-2017a]|nr:uncharacterized protein UDID_18453 [Ustilago sp. UG-2017a]